MIGGRPTRRAVLASGTAAGLAGFAAPRRDLALLRYLLPAPKAAIALAPFTLAEHLGFYREASLEVTFDVRRGGMEVGRALARGEGDLGGASGDTAVLLRDQGVLVKGVALLGRHAFLTVMTRRDRAVSLDDLAGRTIGVPSLTDVSTYGLDYVVAAGDRPPPAIRAAPAPDLWTGLASGALDGIVGTVDWGVRAEALGVALDYRPLDDVFPGAMAQAVLAADATIQAMPGRIAAFNHATLRAVRLMLDRPDESARHYGDAVPGQDLEPARISRIFQLFGSEVYGRRPDFGVFDPARLEAITAEYRRRGLIRADGPAGNYFQGGLLEPEGASPPARRPPSSSPP